MLTCPGVYIIRKLPIQGNIGLEAKLKVFLILLNFLVFKNCWNFSAVKISTILTWSLDLKTYFKYANRFSRVIENLSFTRRVSLLTSEKY